MGQVFSNAGIEAAKQAGRDPEMDTAARRVESTIRGVAAPHRKTGRFDSSLKISNVQGRRGVRDRLVSSDDPDAMSIEFGHELVTQSGVRTGRWIPGLRIFNRAFDILKRGG